LVGDRKGIWPVKKLGVGLLVELCKFACHIASAVTITSIILVPTESRTEIFCYRLMLMEKWPLKRRVVVSINTLISYQPTNIKNNQSLIRRLLEQAKVTNRQLNASNHKAVSVGDVVDVRR